MGASLVSVFALPLLILGGMLEWLIPAASPDAVGHGLGLAIPGAYLFLFLWLGSALLTVRLVSRLPRTWVDGTLPAPVAALQWVLVAVALLGGIPLLTFDLAPDPSSIAISVLTASICPVIVIVVSIAQFMVLQRIPRDAEPAVSPMSTAILGHAPRCRIGAAVIAAACATATAGFLIEELRRVAAGSAGDYGTVPFVLLVAVAAAGLPYSWVVVAITSLALVAHLAAGLGPAPAALDAAAIIAVSLPAAANAIRAARIASSDEALIRWTRRHLHRDRRRRLPLETPER
jgi:hypothetical protein